MSLCSAEFCYPQVATRQAPAVGIEFKVVKGHSQSQLQWLFTLQCRSTSSAEAVIDFVGSTCCASAAGRWHSLLMASIINHEIQPINLVEQTHFLCGIRPSKLRTLC